MVIVAAVDRSDRAHEVVSEAVSLGKAFGDPVHVVHSMTRAEFIDLGLRSVESDDRVTMDEVREMARKVASDALEDAGVDGSVDVSTVGLIGDPDESIVDYAGREDARYIVVMGRKKSPTAKALFGSVAQSILLNASCPVVTPSVRRHD